MILNEKKFSEFAFSFQRSHLLGGLPGGGGGGKNQTTQKILSFFVQV